MKVIYEPNEILHEACIVCFDHILVQINKGSGVCSEECRKKAVLIPGTDHKYMLPEVEKVKKRGKQSAVSRKAR